MQGFILTRHWRDTASGINLEFWLSSDDGPLKLIIPRQQAIFFVRQSDHSRVQQLLATLAGIRLKPLSLKNTHGELVLGIYCQQQRNLRKACERLDTANIAYWESDIRPYERFLMERFVTSSLTYPESARQVQGSRYKQLVTDTVKPSDYAPQLRVVSIDIETSMDAKDLYSIAVYSAQQSIVFMVANHSELVDIDAQTFDIEWCSTPRHCLQAFLRWIEENDPDILIGWHVIQFDCWVLAKLCERWKLPFALGRDQQVPHWRTDSANRENPNASMSGAVADTGNQIFDGSRHYLQVPGRVVLDGIELLRTAFYRFDSFSLQSVAHVLLGEGKLLDGDDRGHAIGELFAHDKLALARYNLQDCKLVWDIFEKTKLLDFALEKSRLTGLPLDKMGGSVASFEYAYLPLLHRQHYVAPNLGELKSDISSPGGYVMQSLPGLYRHVLVLDFKSLYPSIIRTFLIDPCAFWAAQHNQFEDEDIVEGFNGAFFSRDQNILPGVIRDLWKERDKAKLDSNQPLSQAIKIIMNSFYGVLGSTGCRFFDPRVCSSITLRGHDIIQQSHQWIEAQGYQVIYGDTDSLFVWLGEDFCQQNDVDEQAHTIGKSLVHGLNRWWTDYLHENFQLESHLEIEFETHYQHFLMPTIRGSEKGSKKRYAGTINKSGDIQLVFKGLETVRADWTPLAKSFQQHLYQLIFMEKPYRAYIQSVVADVLSGDRDEDMVYSKRLRRPLSGYQKSNPPHIKAARKQEIITQKLFNKGDKIRYVITLNGPESIAYQQSLIDYQHYIDKQLKPIADSILCFLDDSFDKVTQPQIELL